MKKIVVLFLAFTMCIFAFYGCVDSSEQSSDIENIGSADNSDIGNSDANNEISNDGSDSSEYPRDILESIPYNIVCKDKNTQEVVQYQFTDNGRLNDGLYRSKSDLENGTNDDMRVVFDNTSKYNFEITFETDGKYDGYCLIAHNCDFYCSILKIEIGSDLDNMKEIEFEEDNEHTANMHLDLLADFEVTTIQTVRITFTTGTSTYTSFDEISLLGFPIGQADKWIKDESSNTEESSTPDGELDSRLVGTWGADDPEIVEKGGSDYKVVIVLADDGTGTYQQAGLDLPLTWTSSDDVLYMNVTFVGPLTKPYSFKDGKMLLPDEDGRTTEFIKLD